MPSDPVIIHLVRHGEASAHWGQGEDPGLSEFGEQQAQQVGAQLFPGLNAGVKVVSSPLKRAMETARPLADSLHADIQVDAAFSEIAAPVPIEQRQQWLRTFVRQRWHEQSQSLHDWRDAAVRQLLEQTGPAVVFTHFMAINAVVSKVLDSDETLHFLPDNGSITTLRRTGDALELVQLGRELKTVVN